MSNIISSLTGRPPIISPFASQFDMQRMTAQNAVNLDPGWLESMAIQTNFPFNAENFDRIRGVMEMGDEAMRIANQEVDAFLFEYGNYFTALYEKWWENINFFHHFHWTARDIKKIKEAGLQPYISPHMWRWIMTLIGEQTLTKTQWKASPKSPESKDYTELAGGILNAFASVNDWDRIETQTFIDGAVGCLGVAQVTPDPLDPRGNVLIDRVNPWEMMWSREAKNGSLDGARIVARGRWYDTEQLIARYPMWRERLMKYNPSSYYRDHHFIFRIHEPKVQSLVTDQQQPVYMPQRWMSRSGKGTFVLEFYRRRPKHVYRVTDANYNVDFDFDNLPQAGEFYMTLSQAYRARSIAETGQDADPMIAEPRECWPMVTDQEIWAGQLLLDKQTLPSDSVPYEFYAPLFQDGMLTGFFEGEKSSERMRDRIMIYLDMMAASAKPKTTINVAKLPRDLRNNLQEVKRIMNRQNEILFVDDREPGSDVSRIVTQTSVPNIGPFADSLQRFVETGSAHNLGGMAYTGTPDYSGQSGISQQTSAAAASTGTALVFEEQKRFSKRVASKVLIAAQHILPTIQLCTVDRTGESRFFRVMDAGIQSLHGLKFETDITEVAWSPSVRQAKLNSVFALLQNGGPELQAAVLPEILDLTDMEVSRIDRIMERLKEGQDAQQAQVEHEQMLATHQMLMKWEDMKAHRETERMLAAVKANPPFNKTLQVKADAGPGMLAEIANQSGIPADTAGVISDWATGAEVQQKIDNAAQKAYNDLEVDFQRQVAKFAAAGNGSKGAGRPKGSSGVLTPKDRKSRSK